MRKEGAYPYLYCIFSKSATMQNHVSAHNMKVLNVVALFVLVKLRRYVTHIQKEQRH